MADIVNLRQVRKRMAREQSERVAAGNRVAFGTPKPERQRLQAEADRAGRLLDGAKRDPGGTEALVPTIPDDRK